MTWPEVKEIIDKIRVAIIPAGSNEQHGPHLTFQTDISSATYVARKAAEKLYPQVLVTPPISIGVSPHHMQFPGSLTLRSDTLINIVLDICQSLNHHGIRKILILNGHGGNTFALNTAGTRVKYELGLIPAVVDYWNLISPKEAESILEGKIWPGHACEFETSMALAMNHEFVREAAITRPEDFFTRLPAYHRFLVGSDVEYSRSGVKPGGDPSLATKEKGEKLINAAVNGLISFLTDFIGHEQTADLK